MHKEIKINATGETIVFIKTGKDTDGAYVETLNKLPASGEGPRTHRHVFQTEYFEAIEGRLGLDCGDEQIILEPGESFTVPANTFHRCYAVDGVDIQFKAVFTPALSIEYFLTEMFVCSNLNKSAEPSMFNALYIIRQTNEEYYLKDFPAFFQDSIFPILIGIGKLLNRIKAQPNPDKK